MILGAILNPVEVFVSDEALPVQGYANGGGELTPVDHATDSATAQASTSHDLLPCHEQWQFIVMGLQHGYSVSDVYAINLPLYVHVVCMG